MQRRQTHGDLVMITVFGYVDYTHDGIPFYVGIGKLNRVKNLERFQHVRNQTPRTHTQICKAYGQIRIVEFEISSENYTLAWAMLRKWECASIKVYNTMYWSSELGCNRTFGGEGSLGFQHSNETKLKISQRKKGTPCSEQHRIRISNANMGRIVSQETRMKKRNSMMGKTHSVETKEKMRRSHQGKKLSDQHRLNLSIAGRGFKHSDEARANMSKAAKKRKRTAEHQQKLNEARRRRARKFSEEN